MMDWRVISLKRIAWIVEHIYQQAAFVVKQLKGYASLHLKAQWQPITSTCLCDIAAWLWAGILA
jgi:hypothetical protein